MSSIQRPAVSCVLRACGVIAALFACTEDLPAAVSPVRSRVPAVIAAPDAEHAQPTRRHSGIPSIAVSKGGRMWATWYGGRTPGEDQNNYCVLSTSSDGGRTWKEVLTADPDGAGPRRTFDPEVWISPDGGLRWFWTDRVGTVSSDPERDQLWMLTLDAEKEPAAPGPVPVCIGRGVMMCKPTVLSTGEWALPTAWWRDDRSSRMLVSSDGGRSFSVRGGARLPEAAQRLFDEHMFIEKRNGDIWCLTRGRKGVWEAFSKDRGATWTDLAPARFAHTSSRFFIRRLSSGNLLLVKHGPIDRDVGRRDLTAFISRDDGDTWEGGLMLDARGGISYPDGQQLADGRVVLTYDFDRLGTRCIHFCMFTEADALAGKSVSGQVRLRQLISGGTKIRPAAEPALFHPTAEAAVEQAHRELTGRLLSPEGLLWDYVGELPTPRDCAECRPNAMGWWSPVENGPMFTGPWLKAMCTRARATGAAEDRALCRKLAEGLLLTASVSATPGMIVRGVGTDGRCHYPLGSCDQTLPWFFGLHAYATSGLAEEPFRKQVVAKMVEVGEALEKIGWKVPSDGAFAGQFRGDFAADSLPFRGATHYLFLLRALYDVTGNERWLAAYRRARDEVYPGRTETRLAVCAAGYLIDRPKFPCDEAGIWIYVCAQGCLMELWKGEADPAAKAQYRKGLDATAASAVTRMEGSRRWRNTRETPFRYANWRTGYVWREQKTQKDADAVAKTGRREILGTRKDEERMHVACPLAAAALCAYAGAGRAAIAETLRRYDYSTVNISEFFLAEVAWWTDAGLNRRPDLAKDGETPVTAALQRVIDEVSAAGGGRVTLGAGSYLVAGILLKDDVTLRLERGAVLLASTNHLDYAGGRHGKCVVGALNARNVALEGEGTVDGRGWAAPVRDNAPNRWLDCLFYRCAGVRVEGVTLTNPASWTCYFKECDGVVARKVTILSHANFNNDGFDIDAKNVLIEDCTVDSDDDAICPKSDNPDFVPENVEVRNCRLSSNCNFIKFGTASRGGFRNFDIHHCTLTPASRSKLRRWRNNLPGVTDPITGLAGIALEMVDGGVMENVRVHDIVMEGGVQTPVFVRLGRRAVHPSGRPSELKHCTIENIVCKSTASFIASSITGVPGLRVQNLLLRNLDLTVKGGCPADAAAKPVPEAEKAYPENRMFGKLPLPAYGFYVRHADGVRFENVKLRYDGPREARPAVVQDDCTGVVFSSCDFRNPVKR